MLTVEPKKYPDRVYNRRGIGQSAAGYCPACTGRDTFHGSAPVADFRICSQIPLIADYEKKWMMDEAMADNAEWFKPYILDLKNQRFAVIISEPLQIKFQGENRNFSEENDLFVKWVSIPTLMLL